MNFYLDETTVPKGFKYPNEFVRAVEQQLTNLTPWRIIGGELLKNKFIGINVRYPERNLVPFGTRIDNDDVACFELNNVDKVVVIHDFASEGWENRDSFESFWDWFKQAIDDLIEYDA